MNDRARSTAVIPRPIEKVSTQVAGVDAILRGGLPKGRMTLIVGGPGTGKTLLSMEWLYRSALAGQPGILVAFEERSAALRSNAASLGWDLASLEQDGRLFLFDAHVDPRTIVSGDVNFRPMLAIIEAQLRLMGADRIVFDAIDVPLHLLASPERERAELYALNDWVGEHGLTSILTAKTGETTSSRYEFLDFMANTVVWLDQRVEKQSTTRRLRVIKYRGSGFDRNEYPYIISERGVDLLPLTSARLSHRPLGEPVSTGLPVLDRMLGGGLLRGACVVIAGTSGAGKTLLASTFAATAAARGERVLYISFEESREALFGAIESAGIELQPWVEKGLISVLGVLPESRGAEEHLIEFIHTIAAFDPAHVVLDAASATDRFRGETASFDFLVRFINACKEQGRTSLLIDQLKGLETPSQITGLNISSVVDTIIHLRQPEEGGEFVRSLTVLKSRGAKHSNQRREFRITDNGLEFPAVFVGEGGTVSGVARQEREARELIEARRMERQLHAKEAELAQMRAAMAAQAAEFRSRIELAEAELDGMRLERDLRQRGTQERERMRGGSGQE